MDTGSSMLDRSDQATFLEAYSFLAGDPVGEKVRFDLTLTDEAGARYTAQFYVRNHYVGMVDKAIRRLIPVRIFHTGPRPAVDPGPLFTHPGIIEEFDATPSNLGSPSTSLEGAFVESRFGAERPKQRDKKRFGDGNGGPDR